MRIVIAGGSGQVGTILARHFYAGGHQVVVLSRHPYSAKWQTGLWDGQNAGAWAHHLEGRDVCINLAGRSVNCRYHAENRKLIYDSRVNSTRLLNQAIAALRNPPPLWINASTATIYRHSLDRPMDEISGELGGSESASQDTWKFSIKVAKAWEQAFFETLIPGTRKIAIRTAMNFSPDRGGVFDVFLGLVRRGFGGRQGSGKQYVSWIHDSDFTAAIDFLIKHDELSGVINVASPHPLPNSEFMQILRTAWGARIGMPTPRLILEIGTFLLRTESELVLKSRRVVPRRLQESGFQFSYPGWAAAARNLVARWRRIHESKG